MAQPPPCPYCDASSYRLRDSRWLVCEQCAHEFDLEHDLCRTCGRLNRAEADNCAHCQAPLRQDTVDQLIVERSLDRLDWRGQRTAIAVELKKQEAEASERQLEAYWAEDRARREAQARARAEQREREKRVLIAMAVIAVVIILALVALAVLSSLGRDPQSTSATLSAAPQAEPVALWALHHTRQTRLA